MASPFTASLGLLAVISVAGCSDPEFVGNPTNIVCAADRVSETEMREAFLQVEAETGDVTRSYLSHVDPEAVAFDWTDASSDDERHAFKQSLLETEAFVSVVEDFDECDT